MSCYQVIQDAFLFHETENRREAEDTFNDLVKGGVERSLRGQSLEVMRASYNGPPIMLREVRYHIIDGINPGEVLLLTEGMRLS